MITSKEYAGKLGGCCPYCGSLNLDGYGSFDVDGNEVSQEVGCNDCLKEWFDIYTLTGYAERS